MRDQLTDQIAKSKQMHKTMPQLQTELEREIATEKIQLDKPTDQPLTEMQEEHELESRHQTEEPRGEVNT